MVRVIAESAAFIRGFFGPGNSALPGADLSGPRGPRVEPYLAPLLAGVRRVMVLPRTHPDGRTDAYVIAWDAAEAARTRRLIEAFVGYSLVSFDGRLSRLSADDPVEAAVIDLVGPNTTYVLRPPAEQAAQQALWRRLATLRDLLNARPERELPMPRPVGRLVAELLAAIAAGAAQTSADLLDELAGVGGISPLNLAYLRAHRLGRLGRSSELLRLPDFDDIVASRPPADIAEAILGAWAQIELDGVEFETADDVSRVAAGAGEQALRLAPLCAGVELVDPAVRLAAAVICLVRRDTVLAARLAPVDDLPPPVVDAVAALVAPAPPAATMDEPIDTKSPESWVEWVRELGSSAAEPHDLGPDWARWSRPVTTDAELASAIDDVGDRRADAVWGAVGPFLEADELSTPAWQSAGSFLFQAGAYGRWAPADLVSVQALLEVFTRGAPPAAAYGDVLEIIQDSVPRWASAANVERTLDILDVLARAACPDSEARTRVTTLALEPLYRGRRRLPADLIWLAGQIAAECGLDLDWTPPGGPQPEDTSAPASYGDTTLLVYSLDPGALQRTVDGLVKVAPGLKVHQCSQKVGTDQLREQTRSADAIALATRCAKHAATGFIRKYARAGAPVQEADGAGSASLLRAAIAALGDLRATD